MIRIYANISHRNGKSHLNFYFINHASSFQNKKGSFYTELQLYCTRAARCKTLQWCPSLKISQICSHRSSGPLQVVLRLVTYAENFFIDGHKNSTSSFEGLPINMKECRRQYGDAIILFVVILSILPEYLTRIPKSIQHILGNRACHLAPLGFLYHSITNVLIWNQQSVNQKHTQTSITLHIIIIKMI